MSNANDRTLFDDLLDTASHAINGMMNCKEAIGSTHYFKTESGALFRVEVKKIDRESTEGKIALAIHFNAPPTPAGEKT